MRRAGLVQRQDDGTWQVPEDYLEKASDFERARRGALDVQVRSWISLEDQVERHGLTWLDEAGEAVVGGRLVSARRARVKWLREQGLLEPGESELRPAVRVELVRAEQDRVSVRLSGQTSRQVIDLEQGERLDGRYEGTVDFGHGRFAIIGNSKEFALVPWRAGVERHRGREMVARRTAKGVSWTVGTGREKGLSR